MYKIILPLVAILSVFASCSDAESERIKPPGSDQVVGYDTLKLGKEFFGEKCAVCHGDNGRLGAGGAKSLPDTKLSIPEIEQQIQQGKKAMPSFKRILTEEQILALAKYVLTLRDTLK